MDSRSLKVFIACFLGGGIGTLIASSLTPYLWWIGLLVGMLTGYLAYEFEKVLKAIPEAFKTAFSWISEIEFQKKWGRAINAILIASCIMEPFALFIVLFSPAIKSGNASTIPIFAFTFGIPFLIGFLTDDNTGAARDFVNENALRYNFFIFYFYLIPMYAIDLLISIPMFVKTLFILIHSDERLLCMVDAGIGCAIGHLFGNIAIIGAVSGGLMGILHYELISKRILKLIPIEASPRQED